jgi:hypothetical protein
MKYRIAMWAGIGILVAYGWAFYAYLTHPTLMTSTPIVWMLAQLMCPIVLLGTHLHFGVKLYWVAITNAAAYALVGLLLESARQRFSRVR